MRTPIKVECDSSTRLEGARLESRPGGEIRAGRSGKKEDGILGRLNESVQNTVSIPFLIAKTASS